MNSKHIALSVLAFVLVHAMPAQAQLARTFLSANGSDANDCARTAPCRTLQVAHDKTNAGGEINMLDPAGFGRVVIQKAISIVNDGVGSAGILVPASSTGIRIVAGNNDKINLRGLIIEGGGIGEYGIVFQSGKSLTIQNSVIRNMTISGIAVIPSASFTTSTLAVSDTYIANNGSHGVVIQPVGSNVGVQALFNRVEVYNNGGHGIGLYANLVSNQGGIPRRDVEAAVVDSVSAYNGGSGFYAFNDPAEHYFATLLSISRSTSTFNEGFGIEASGLEVFLYFGQSMISDGARQLNGAEVWSYGDNYMQRVTAPRLAPKS